MLAAIIKKKKKPQDKSVGKSSAKEIVVTHARKKET